MKTFYFIFSLVHKLRLIRLRLKLLKIGNGSVVSKGFEIGDSQNISIGNYVYIGPNSSIWGTGGVTIMDSVIIGPRVTIHSSNHDYNSEDLLPYGRATILKPVTIERCVWIGDKVMIAPGVTIGEGSIIAMGSVVTKDIPKFSVAGGNPAKVIKVRKCSNYESLVKEEKFYLKNKFNL